MFGRDAGQLLVIEGSETAKKFFNSSWAHGRRARTKAGSHDRDLVL